MLFRSTNDIAVRCLTDSQPGQGVFEGVSVALPGCGAKSGDALAPWRTIRRAMMWHGSALVVGAVSQVGASQEVLPGNDSTGSDENARVVLTGTSIALSCVSIEELP